MPRVAKVGMVELTPQFIDMLQQWETIAKQAKELKAAEFALRQQIVSQIGDPTKLEGTEKTALGAGYILESKKTQNYTLTNKFNETVNLCAAIAAAGHVDIANGLVKWTPEMSKSTYNELLKIIEIIPSGKQLLAAALTIKPGAPELEIKAPKAAENGDDGGKAIQPTA